MSNNTELKPCPFCGSTKIKYSTKINQRGRNSQYHACYYCNTCHCYGARVLSQHVDTDNYATRRDMEMSEMLQNAARDAWNKRFEIIDKDTKSTRYAFIFKYNGGWMMFAYEKPGTHCDKYFNGADDEFYKSLDYIKEFMKNGGNVYTYYPDDYDDVICAINGMNILELNDEPITELEYCRDAIL